MFVKITSIMYNIAVIVAGGSGNRFGGNTPKQFLEVSGKQIIEHTIQPFLELDTIEHVLIVCHQRYLEYTRLLFQQNEKVSVIVGGKTRFHSSFNAIKHIKENFYCNNVLIHDAARPLISKEIIQNCIDALKQHKAVTVVIPASDTILRIQNSNIIEIPKREEIYINQTPQCFNFEIAYDCFINAQGNNFTDDCSVILNACEIKIVEGSRSNIKITTMEDLKFVKGILKSSDGL